MKIYVKKYFSLTILAIAGAMMSSCGHEDILAEGALPECSRTVTLTTTISLGDDEATRALDANGKKTFASGDKIAVFYTNTSGETKKVESAALTTTDITDGGKKATISVTMTDPKANGQLRLVYPAKMAMADRKSVV